METFITYVAFVVFVGLIIFSLYSAIKKRRALTIQKVITFLRRKGIAVNQDSDTSAAFKLNDENLWIDVAGGRFQLLKAYDLPDDMPRDVLMHANNELTAERYCLKAFIRNWPERDKDGNVIEGTIASQDLVFSCESLCNSYNDFVRQYEWTLYGLQDGINYHRQLYGYYLQRKDEGRPNKIGFLQQDDVPSAEPKSEATAGQARKIGFIQ